MSGLREFGESTVSAVLERVGRGVSRVQERSPLAHDLLESDDAYLVVFDVPGATREDLQVRFLEGEVQIRVDRFRDFHEGFEMRFPGRGLSLDGSAKLPSDAAVDAKKATATLSDNGTLRVRIPKEGTTTTVEVREEGEEGEADDGVGRADAAERGTVAGSDGGAEPAATGSEGGTEHGDEAYPGDETDPDDGTDPGGKPERDSS